MRNFFILFCLISSFAFSQNPFKYTGFSGGMMVHSGFLQQSGENGMPFGLGGCGKVHFGKYLRVGAEGYVSDLTYGNHNSISSVSWGGLLIDLKADIKRFTPFTGVLLGGGSFQNIILSEGIKNDFGVIENAGFRKYSFMAFCPFLGMEYALNDKIRLTLKADYLMNLNNEQDFPNGLRVFIGCMFYRLKTE